MTASSSTFSCSSKLALVSKPSIAQALLRVGTFLVLLTTLAKLSA
jgi:hypothetical protein